MENQLKKGQSSVKTHYFIQDVNEEQCGLEPEAKTREDLINESEEVEMRRVGGTEKSKDGPQCSAAKKGIRTVN